MKKIYCFVEEESEKTREFLQSWQKEDIIIFMSDIIEGCEGKMLYALGELISQLLCEEGTVVFATDIRELYDVVVDLYTPYLEQAVYLDVGVLKVFEEKLDMLVLLDFEEKLLIGSEIRLLLHRYRNLSGKNDLQKIFDLSVEIYASNERSGWSNKAFWAQVCRIYSQLIEFQGYQVSSAFKLLNLSMQMKLEKNVNYTNQYLECVYNTTPYGAEEYYFVWNQFKAIGLMKLAAINGDTTELLHKMYHEAYRINSLQLDKKLSLISKERKRNRVLVLTIQFLASGHAPTNTVMERCKSLAQMGKEVYLINTAEQYILKGYIPLHGTITANVLEENYTKKYLQIEDFSIPFMQLSEHMSLEKRLDQIISVINEFKPWYILSIGSGSMLADLCGRVVPCAAMALAFSTLPHTMNQMKILGRQASDKEREEWKDKKIIESRFTFELKKQKGHFTRREMNLPEDKFLLVVVGIRLDYEVTEEFLHMFENILEKQAGCFVVFAGVYDSFSSMLESHPQLKGNTQFIGYCEDIPALMEICDLYVNPKRLGGGFSVIEAFVKGVPGVYLPMGDVYVAGGEEFAVADFEKMEEQIMRYQNDSQYYQEMSVKAKKRAALMTSGVEAMRELDSKICAVIEEKGVGKE